MFPKQFRTVLDFHYDYCSCDYEMAMCGGDDDYHDN